MVMINRLGQVIRLRFVLFAGVLALFWLAGCATPQPLPQEAAVLTDGNGVQNEPAVPAQPSATATLQPTATLTPLPTLTPTPTPTPTPTAVPIAARGNPREGWQQAPVAQTGAACGIVDILDFPMDPPDAENVTRGGQDFGVFRQRYDSYHAGEDWWVSRGEGNFGLPVYSIGHGTVTYAEPLGWGRDQGIVIVRHIFADGRTFLSFYGHLDPPSITLRAGECVVRGQKVGEIGRPRTPPHLHFEIRTHLPTQPGGGYWDVDPTLAGWLPPSQTIWEQRNTEAPGVVWSWPITGEGSMPVGALDAQTFLLLENEALAAVNVADGRVQWRLEAEMPILSAQPFRDGSQVVVAGRQGEVVAYELLPDASDNWQSGLNPLWQQNLNLVGQPTLMPMPDGGVLVAVRQRLSALASDGGLLWENELDSQPLDWTMVEGQLILASSGRNGLLWTVTADGLVAWPDARNGRFFTHGDRLMLYAQDGIYQLDPDSQTAVLWYALPSLFGSGAGAVSLPDGSLLLLHSDTRDRRLLLLNQDGSLRWERSLRGATRGDLALLMAGDRVLLTALDAASANHELRVYGVSVAAPGLTHLYTGGTRQRGFSGSWVQGTEAGLLLVQIDGGNLVALDVELAATAVLSE